MYHSTKSCSKVQVSAKVTDPENTLGTELASEEHSNKEGESMWRQRTHIRDSESRPHKAVVQNEKETDVIQEFLREKDSTRKKKNPRENSIVWQRVVGESHKRILFIRRNDDRQQRESVRES